MKRVGAKIREIRMRHGDTLEKLGEKIDFNYSNLSKIERGVREPSIELVKQIADLYEVPLSYFFGEEATVPDELKEVGVEWITFAKEMQEKKLTPEQIKATLELIEQLKKS